MEGKKRGVGRPKGDRNDISVKVDRRLAEMGRLLAAHRNVTLAQLVSELLRDPLEKGYAKMLRDLEKKAE